ncbi:CapA family protein [Bacillus sonorensis]|uniref:PGA biosynthesis protein CapA n=2 Tax=Bacillus sonorensis TaxID=119858 RepID=M5P1V8_9BACI|nr:MULTISPECIES: CapA family protein [Bacillus]TWK80597.1 Capsule biosynthesis protein CapA [Bacillus paralicheniformis]ASB87116.1 Capsule biosynthesis protein CapA [Bacillus sonorensis]EME73403.1 PGA biosynthesis protein CapA [Bacillus sonorensis L12]MBG9914383.1 capsular biosynthesis protein [Bacillus sonorensis]MCF7616364.1 CapA family protein [Bacillus sonorensis]
MKKQLNFQEKLLKLTKQEKKKTHKHVLIALPVIFCLMFVFTWFGSAKTPSQITKQKDAKLTATFVGDIMMGRNVEKVTKLHGPESVFKNVKPYFDVSDFITGNFENPATKEKDYQPAEKNIHLQTNLESVETLKNMNFSVMNFANNHAMDYGQDGLNDTLNKFTEENLDIVGAGKNLDEAKQHVSYQNVNGVKIATLGFTDTYTKNFTAKKNRGGVLPLSPKVFIPMIAEASKKADLVVVHVHWGQEYDNEPNDRQRDLAKAIADAGADVILGAHPHVLEPIEVYNGTAIFYSLGNFVFDQGWSRTRDSALVQYHLMNDGKGRFEVTPLNIREATPSPLGKSDFIKREAIFRQLTKGTGLDWKEENGKLTFEVDHTDKLKNNENGVTNK